MTAKVLIFVGGMIFLAARSLQSLSFFGQNYTCPIVVYVSRGLWPPLPSKPRFLFSVFALRINVLKDPPIFVVVDRAHKVWLAAALLYIK